MGTRDALVVGGSQTSGATSTNSGLGEILAIDGGPGLVGVLLTMFALGRSLVFLFETPLVR